MKRLVIVLVVLVVLVLIFAGGVIAASEMGEVVVLKTGEGESARSTRLWIVDAAGQAWLRAGSPDSKWLVQLRAQPDVELDRAGRTEVFRAVPVESPEVRAQINQLFAQKYGFANTLTGLMRDESGVTPILLEAPR